VEFLPDFFADGTEDVEFKRGLQQFKLSKFSKRKTRFVHKFTDSCFIFESGVIQKSTQLFAAARLYTFKKAFLCCRIGGDVNLVFCTEKNPVSRVELNEFVKIRNAVSEVAKELFEYFWHPVPARAHVKHKPLFFKQTRPSSGLRKFF